MATWTNITKNISTFVNSFRHGKEPLVGDLAGKIFTDTLYDGNTKQIKDFTFSELTDQVWTNQAKNTSTFTNVPKN